MRMRSSQTTLRAALLGAFVLGLLHPHPAIAADDGEASPKREKQDYGAPKDTSVEEVLLWGPRVVLFPLWLVSEYVVRRPLGAIVKVAEKEQVPQEILNFFTFGERKQFTVLPSAFFDFGLLPSVGFNAKWRYFLTDPNTLRWHLGTWGIDWISTKVVDSYALSKTEDIGVDVRFVRRQDNPFYGLGPKSQQGHRSRFASDLFEAAAFYESRPWKSSSIGTRGGFRYRNLKDEGTCCDDPTIYQAIQRGAFARPPGLGQWYSSAFQDVRVALDSRKPRPESGSGVRLEANAEGVFSPAASTTDRAAWVRYGGAAGAFLDLTGTQRVVSLSVAAELADPLLGAVPFPEQASLGGDRPMRGYLRNRLIDRSSFVASLHYTWPIWVFLDGVIEIDAGNVFGAGFEGMDPKLFRLSSGIGVRSNGERDSGFEMLIAGATDPLNEGFAVSSFRFVLGSHHGF